MKDESRKSYTYQATKGCLRIMIMFICCSKLRNILDKKMWIYTRFKRSQNAKHGWPPDHNIYIVCITGQYCGRLLKFSAHSLNVLGIRYKDFKYVFLLIISYIHIYETIFQICFFYWWYHIYIYTRPYWDAISWDNSYMMIIWSTWPLKIPNT